MLISRDAFVKRQKEREERRNSGEQFVRSNVSFMTLGSGDEAVIRFAPSDKHEIIYFHNETDDWKSRKIACTREDFKDPIDNCPFCAAKKPLKSRYYVKMLQYVRNDDGDIEIVPKVWDAPTMYVTKIMNLEEEYGDLSNMVFKMKRNGAGQQTTYDFLPAMSTIYNESIYKKDFSELENYKALGTLVKELPVEEMRSLLTEEVPVQPATVNVSTARKVTY